MKQASESYLYSSLLSVKNFLLCISPYCCFVIRIIKAKRRVNTADNQVLCILGVDLSECSLANSLMFFCVQYLDKLAQFSSKLFKWGPVETITKLDQITRSYVP